MKNYEDTKNKILGNLLRNPLESKSLNQIAINTGLSYVTVHKLAPDLLKRNLIKIEKKGKASLVSINLEQADTGELSSAMLFEKKRFLRKHSKITLIGKELEEALNEKFYILVLFGSYAREKQRSDSDIDLLFIVPYRKDVEKYKEKINEVLGLIPGKKHTLIVSAQDFADMLNEKYTVGRAAFQQGVILFGIEQYYSMVKHYAGTKGY